jgi:short subunit dehydrogenase-like uncharacterized protein
MIAVYGATGHTGRLVAAELARRRQEPLLLGRRDALLAALSRELPGRTRWQAIDLHNSHDLREALASCQVVINCAGPFSETARPVATAAVDGGAHYVDVTAEPPVMKDLADLLGGRAADSGLALVAGAGFYVGLSDCLARHLESRPGSLREVTVAYLVENWRMTRASRQTAMQLMRQPRLVYEEGRLREGPVDRPISSFWFPPPHGDQEVVAYPGGEVLTIPRHTPCEKVRVLMTTSTFDAQTFASDEIAPKERAASSFVVVVDGLRPSGPERAWVVGYDIYNVGAVTAVEAARLLAQSSGDQGGALAPAQLLDAARLFSQLRRLSLLTEVNVSAKPAATA